MVISQKFLEFTFDISKKLQNINQRSSSEDIIRKQIEELKEYANIEISKSNKLLSINSDLMMKSIRDLFKISEYLNLLWKIYNFSYNMQKSSQRFRSPEESVKANKKGLF